jgi:glycosyltransferase involved in cell wall biosynthesis
VAVLYGHPLEMGGVETHLLSLMKGSNPLRYRYRVVGEARSPFRERALAAGAEIVPWSPRSARDLSALRQLPRLLQGVALVHAHSPRALAFARFARFRAPHPLVFTVHVPAGAEPGPSSRLYARAESLLARGAERIIFVSSRALEAAPPSVASRAVFIPNGLTLKAAAGRDETRRALNVPEGELVGITVARLEPRKGISTLLEALPLVPGISFWIVGDGPERPGLEIRSRELGLEGRVRFLGARADVPALLGAADLFVLPSLYEGMPMALLEALASGIPSVATDVGDNAVLLAGAGLIVPPGEPAALARVVQKLVGSPEERERLARGAREAAPRWGESAMVEQTTAVYDAVLGGGGPANSGGGRP